MKVMKLNKHNTIDKYRHKYIKRPRPPIEKKGLCLNVIQTILSFIALKKPEWREKEQNEKQEKGSQQMALLPLPTSLMNLMQSRNM